MDALSTDTKREIVRRVFPDLRYGGDPDVERYFELRRGGRMSEALAVYNGCLRVRYPDDSARIALLGLYRANDPRYAELQEKLLLQLGDRLAAAVSRNIDILVQPLVGARLNDALSALKAVEGVLARLGRDSEAALVLLARYADYALVLRHREAEARRALELVREYDAVSRSDSPADYDFVARSEALEERRRASAAGSARPAAELRDERYDFVARSAQDAERERAASQRATTHFFDPGKIKFTAAERAEVEISPALTRREDKVLAFCAKYWTRAREPAFEREVFLYARKYGTRHYEVFRAVKLGRVRGSTDDEILSAVSAILSSTKYDYSLSGDLYMQVMWRRIRRRMEAREVAERLAAPGPESRVRAAHKAAQADSGKREDVPAARPALSPVARSRPAAPSAAPPAPPRPAVPAARPSAAPAKPAPSRQAPAAPVAAGGAQDPVRRAAPPRAAEPLPPPPRSALAARAAEIAAAARPRQAAEPAAASRKAASQGPAAAGMASPSRRTAPAPEAEPRLRRAAADVARPVATARDSASRKPALSRTEKASGARLLQRAPSGKAPVAELRGKGSISDKIRALSGKAYDVYKEIFLERVRDDIHRALLAHPTRSHSLFDTASNEAEDQVYGFMVAHYDDPFMDWDASAERAAVESLGYAMPSLDPVIEACFKKL